MLKQLGYSGRPNDTPDEKQKRAILFEGLGNVGNDPEVIQQAQAMVQQYMKDPGSIDGTLAHAVVCGCSGTATMPSTTSSKRK